MSPYVVFLLYMLAILGFVGIKMLLADLFKIPVRYIGIGEKMEDLQVFNRQAFVESLFE